MEFMALGLHKRKNSKTIKISQNVACRIRENIELESWGPGF